MGSVINFTSRRRLLRPEAPEDGAQPKAGHMVACCFCGEPHPVVRLAGGEERCITAFFDGANWFCRNRGCRRSWLDARPERQGGRNR
jgi:hypothetical protein